MEQLPWNVTVLDLTRLLPGGVATRLLVDLGFNVIKVEDTEKGDYMRETSPEVFNYLNYGKKSISINLKDDRGREIFYELVRKSRIVIESFRSDVVKRLKIDYDTLRVLNEKLIYCSITGYGYEGPLLPNHDINCNAYAGIDKVLPVQVADIGSSLLAVIGILNKMWRNEGGFVDVSMAGASKLFNVINILTEGKSVLNGDYPCYNLYESKDGKISLGALEPKFWVNFLHAVGREELINRQFDPNAIKDVSEIVKSYTTKELMEIAERYDVPIYPVRRLGEVKREFKYERGPVRGENTLEILKILGVPETKIKELAHDGVVLIQEKDFLT
ncbi:CaiB/BaiF CoA transferase family protein [Sulfolobus acidocaldarius]|uniref:CoA-transferase family III n=4 Tax=Sulfolobus acidocaldarius TaxID=2285 RepID=Q4J855_SULAC|nr:CaiB/BaiF CoA-transferase family protein [Sulfolobus acidocaldarius]AAY81032.1 CoA-transferase family III [Sulfolobus acidocaldarius DSM 639]AGE71638.1 CoA-transferase family III protein [Sulfolobus acidocaldarius N8]AGE73912.1 CoA-transferase family III protein [Sulfolobus acidocaldarius Ron12/I]ALU30147.1 CoA-transferase [Sulfolobus acidocaldarius]ALU30841.1 CoA-transferase [Sulfolobus acidocaldarius]